MSAQNAQTAYEKAGGRDRFISIFGGPHFDDPDQTTVESTPMYKAEYKTRSKTEGHQDLIAWLKTQKSDFARSLVEADRNWGLSQRQIEAAERMRDRAENQDDDEVRMLAEWLSRQTWSDFAQSLASQYESKGFLSEKQLAAARKMQAKVEARNNEKALEGQGIEGLDLSDLPAGLYAVPGGDTRLKVRVNRPDSGRWEGFIFVDDGAEYGQRQKYGMQAPGRSYNGGIQNQLRAIMEDLQGARERYAEITGRCYACNRKLEDEESVRLGIGPICRSK